MTPVLADLTDAAALTAALADSAPTHVFITAWARQATEAENIAVNAGIVRNVLAALRPAGSVRHVALMTGLKHYLGPFEAYGAGNVPDTPFHEDEPRLPYPNFYYAQEDELCAAAERDGFTWSVHRAHTVIGYAVGNAMNMGLTLAVQAAALPGDRAGRSSSPAPQTQWNALTDMTDAGLLAEQMHLGGHHARPRATRRSTSPTATSSAGAGCGRAWPRPSASSPWGFEGAPRPLEEQMAGTEPVWTALAERDGLREPDIDRVASWWHTDGDLGRDIECSPT